MRKVLATILSVALMILILPIGAFDITAYAEIIDSGECFEYMIWSLDDEGTLTISAVSGQAYMPDYTSTNMPWYHLRDSIKSIVIEEGVVSIGTWAFFKCTNLTNITLSNSVIKIGDYSFHSCSALDSIDIPNGITSIGRSAFANCTNLNTITFSDSITEIKTDAFYNTGYYNSSLNWENNILYLNNYLIKAKTNISGSCRVKEGVRKIADSAFYNCRNLTSVIFPNSIISIGDWVLEGCSNLESITIPFIGKTRTASNDYNAVFGYIFGTTTSDTEGATYQYSYWSMDYYYNIPSSLKKVVITDTTCIPYHAFYNCSNLTSITISDNIKSIESSAFYNCTKLENVYYTGNDKDRQLISILSGNTNLENAYWKYDYCLENGNKHIYDDCYDTYCEDCGKTRSIIHYFEWVIDSQENCGMTGTKHEECIICHAKQNENTLIEPTNNHSYDNDCDNICNICEQPRTAPHYYEWVVDKSNNCGVEGIKHEECTECHIVRNENTEIAATGNHTFTDDYDLECDVCERDFLLIKFDCNGGANVEQRRVLPNETVTLPSCSRNGYNFAGWAITKNGDVKYQASSTLSIDKSITLYAQWDKLCSTCGGDGQVPNKCAVCDGKGFTLSKKDICSSCDGAGHWCDICNYPCNDLGHAINGDCYECSRCNGKGYFQISSGCTGCGGLGYQVTKEKECTACHGTGKVVRQSVSTPSAPMLKSVNSTTVILQEIENGEYSMDGKTWQDSPIFENLIDGRKYKFYQRYAKTDTTLASDPSTELIVVAHNHQYDNTCDVECNICKSIRTITHTYSSECDMTCNVCFDTRTATAKHTYTDGFDLNCNECEYIRTLKDIGITSKPQKTEYLENKENLDLTGGKLTIYYTDDTSNEIVITSNMVSGFNNKIVGQQTLTVTYEGFKDTYDVEIVAKTLISISITTKPNKLTYLEGDVFDKADMVVTAYYNNDTSGIVTDYTVSGYTSTPGTKTITVTYKDKTSTFNVTVIAKSLISISVTTRPNKTTYIESTALDDTGMVLTLYYNNNTSETLTTGWVSEYDFSNVGTSVVEVTYDGRTCTYDVTVIAKALTSIVVESEPNKLEYLEGDASLDTDGLVIRAYYNNDTSEIISGNYTVTGYNSTPGEKTITVTYQGKTVTFTVNVKAKSVTSISVTKKPNKLIYLEGESFDKTGMVITAYYNNNTSSAVTDYTVSGYTSTVGTNTITVSYGGKSATFSVTVNSKVPSTITSSKHAVNGTNISKISAGTTVTNLLNGLNEGSYCKVYKGSSVVSGNTAVGTGMTVKIMDGNTAKATYTIVVTGDTNGDGNITVTDMIAIKAHVLKKSTLSGAYAIAADTNGDNGISITDFIQVKAKILGKGSITAR